MMSNTFGNLFTVTTFGESHGDSIGGIIDGCPSGKSIDIEVIHSDNSTEIITCNHTYNKAQIDWFRAGSALNLIRSQKL